MFAKCFAAFFLCAMIISSQQQVVVPAYSAAYVPAAYAYSPYVAAAYPTVWAWGSNKNKANGTETASTATLLNNKEGN
uniref:Nematode Specific Peptide family, group B n=1 Tax=Caenorhabditis japonica TaxID=281687 RepID=A0A8R1E1X9_CAEJA